MSSEAEPPKKQQKIDNDNGTVNPNDSHDYDAETQKALEEIDSCQNDIDALNEKASEEILCVEQKYNKLRKPYYDSRNDVMNKVPNFWLTAFVNHPQISAILDDEEEECLHYLSQVDVEEFDDIKSGYRIKFTFKENPYISNSCLTKEFHLGTTGDPTSESTTIKWKSDMNLISAAGAKQNAAGGNNDYNRTFFQWFTDNTDPAADDIAEVIKDDMWPNPLQYFLAPDIEVEENGVGSSDYEENADDSVVIMGDGDKDGDGEDVEEIYDDDEDEDEEDDAAE